MILEVIRSGAASTLESLLSVLPYVLPFAVALFAWKAWIYYVRRAYVSSLQWVMLEVKLPKEHQKSPQAMEVALGAFHQASNPNWYEYSWLGKVRPWFSLELVSLGGHIHFFIRAEKKFKSIIENHIYSQYPNTEVHEVRDYVTEIPYGFKGSDWSLFGTEFKLAKEDAYPIKTYIDYGLDKAMVKEEQKTDPITSTLEFLGSIGEGEQLWIQILIMAAGKRFLKKGSWFEMEDWKDNAKEIINKLMKRGGAPDAKSESLSPGERTIVEALERSISKLGFDSGIRTLYLAKKDKFNPSNIPSLLGSLRQYNSLNLNGFKPSKVTSFEWWEDPFGGRLEELKKRMFRAYFHRGFFYAPYAQTPFVLNTEELATIYHFPGAVAETPTFGRIESKRGEAPVNLPV